MPERNKSQEAGSLRLGEVLLIFLIALAMTVGLFLWNPFAGALGLVASFFLAIHSYIREKEAQNRAIQAIENLNLDFDELSKSAVFGMPFPMAVLNASGSFLWYNARFKETFQIEESLLGKSYAHLFPDRSLASLLKKKQPPFRMEREEKTYLFYSNVTDGEADDRLLLLYGIDDTENEEIRSLYRNHRLVFASVFLDNYEEVRSKTLENDRPLVFAQIDRLVSRFAEHYGASLIKYESDRYAMILTRQGLDQMKADKFSLLEALKEDEENHGLIRPTASIGIGYGGNSPLEDQRESRQAIDIALARGGDQVVVKSGEEVEYFGGKNQATQRFTKVKARVMSNTLRSFVEEASDVLIMGHQNPDMDSLGACLGALAFCEGVGKEAHIVLDAVPAAIENLYEKVLKELPRAKEKIVFSDKAMNYLHPASLILCLDNHRAQATAAPELLEHGNRIIIIDHHRRGAGYIQEAEIAYIEPVASSTSEMLTELISYQDDIPIPKVTAEGLLAGITVDTKNFYYQTGARTFEAASYLKELGADSIVIKELFKDEWELTRYRAEIIADAVKWRDKIMIGRFRHDLPGSTLLASQAADELLNIRGVTASFVLTPAFGKVHISARSLGEISVQLIMEKIGGGGHLTAAATQLDLSMEKAEEALKEAISAYLEEDSDESHTA